MKTMGDEISLIDLQQGLDELKLSLSETLKFKFIQYVDLLYKWNQSYNLTSLRTKSQMLSHHIFDSLSILTELKDIHSLIDVGSGGGLPGIPVAIARSNLNITLVDSNSKKTAFLVQAVADLGLKNVKVIQARVEVLQEIRCDVVVGRAFAELNDFIGLTKHLLVDNGYWLAMKGTYPYEELSKLPAWVSVAEVKPINVPVMNAERHIIRILLKKEA